MSTLMREDIAALERIEVAACRSWAAAAPLHVARDLGIGLRPIGSGLAIRASKVDILAYNRVLGFGVDDPARAAELDEAIEFFRAAGVPRIMVNLAPTATPRLTEWLTQRGFYLHNYWIRLWRDANEPVSCPLDARVRSMGREHASAFASTDADAFRY